MMVRVIYQDQTAGVIESHLLNALIKKGRIVAYHSVDRWVPVYSKIACSGTGVADIQRYLDEPRKSNSF